jgi:F-type H+-transporting ATPase subunit delta
LTVAHRIYARALFEAAQENGKVDLVHEQVGQLRDAVQSVDDLRLLLENPEVDTRVKEDVLADVASGADELVVNFVKLLAEKGRAAELDEVAAELDALVAAEQRVLDVELTTATELQAGSMRLDASVRGRLERLRHELTHARS